MNNTIATVEKQGHPAAAVGQNCTKCNKVFNMKVQCIMLIYSLYLKEKSYGDR